MFKFVELYWINVSESEWILGLTQGHKPHGKITHSYIDGLVQERRNSIANALELRLSCTNPSI